VTRLLAESRSFCDTV